MEKEIVISGNENPDELRESAYQLGQIIQQWDLPSFSAYYCYQDGDLDTLDLYISAGGTSYRLDMAPGSDRFGRHAEAVISEIYALVTQMMDSVNLGEEEYASVSGELRFERLSKAMRRVIWENKAHRILEIQNPDVGLSPQALTDFQLSARKLGVSSVGIGYSGNARSVDYTFSFENKRGKTVPVDHGQAYMDLREAFRIRLTELNIPGFQGNEGGHGEVRVHLLRPELNRWEHWDHVPDAVTTNRTFDVLIVPTAQVGEVSLIQPVQTNPVWG